MREEKLNPQEIESYLGGTPVTLRLYDTIDSTNSEAKRYALSGGAAPCVFLAESQTAGRGRMGRSFYSPDQTGIYLSLLIPAKKDGSDSVLVTTAASVAVWRAIRDVSGIETGIKWVNDLYYQDRKVCGILAESFFAEERRYYVIGVGVNLYTRDFPAELREIAGGLLPESKGVRSRLAAAITRNLYALTGTDRDGSIMSDYRAHSLVLGRQITYTENGETFGGVAEAIDDLGRLTVRREDGVRALLASGEISLRWKKT